MKQSTKKSTVCRIHKLFFAFLQESQNFTSPNVIIFLPFSSFLCIVFYVLFFMYCFYVLFFMHCFLCIVFMYCFLCIVFYVLFLPQYFFYSSFFFPFLFLLFECCFRNTFLVFVYHLVSFLVKLLP